MIQDLHKSDNCELMETRVLPHKILLIEEGVDNAENLLKNDADQATVGVCPVTVFSTKEGKKAAVLLDFGSELSGGIQIIAKQGSRRIGIPIRIRFGESAQEAFTPLGVNGSCNDHSIRDIEWIIPWNSYQLIGDTGYRFVYIELTEPDSYLELVSVKGIFRHRDLKYVGSFHSNDNLLNKIYDTCAYTIHLNMQEMVWDGIKRDRLVWIGDMHPEILTIRTVFGDIDIVEKSLKHIAQQYPKPEWPNHMTTYSFWYFMILWDWYMYTGKREMLESLKAYWADLLDRILKLVHEDTSEPVREEEFQGGFFLDWPTRWTENAKPGALGLFLLSVRCAMKLCKICEEEELLKKCENKLSILEKMEFGECTAKQTQAMMWQADKVEKKITGIRLSECGGHGMSTFMSYYILCAAADTAGMTTALKMLREYYGAMLSVGATTFWEDFDLEWMRDGATIVELCENGKYDIHGENGKYCYQGFRHSLCHGWSSGPAAFLAEKTAGIHILRPGCEQIEIAPDLGDLQNLEITYPIPQGVLEVKIEKKDGKNIVSYNAPEEVQVSIR